MNRLRLLSILLGALAVSCVVWDYITFITG